MILVGIFFWKSCHNILADYTERDTLTDQAQGNLEAARAGCEERLLGKPNICYVLKGHLPPQIKTSTSFSFLCHSGTPCGLLVPSASVGQTR